MLKKTTLSAGLIAAAGIAGLSLPAQASAAVTFGDVTLGLAGPSGLNLTVFNLSGQYSQSGGSTAINGNVGLASGSSTNVSGNGTISGYVYYENTQQPYATYQSNFSQQVHVGQSIEGKSLGQAVTDVDTAASDAAALTANISFLGNLPQSETLSATGVDTVVSVGSIDETSGNITFSGNANDYFIVNVTGSGGINLSNTGIITSGAIPYNHILFNVEDGDVNVTGGGTNYIDGTFLDVGGDITIHDKIFNGAMIGNNITITSNPTLNADGYVPEPAALGLFALTGAGLLLLGRKRRLT